ncbi:hypothetical protein FGL86_03220 [Pistricoccus aurantiacus]|uniref:Uncharacterized protein n=1 Tax=Pistricoccus aurantiacus TaxID=1883414 RepID=A0A5B8SM74_9GAMM|nr:hypothetical protein [Pistricoccus aurantiacus]QEA38179.1 hypothetical protein FGL86_03220 [Pistricoccus aurantiacus]
MYYLDMPTAEEIDDLNLVRSDACISVYLPTTPITRDIEQSRINLGNLVKKAIGQLEAEDFDKRRIWALQEQFEELLADDDFWNHQAHSLAILATPESLRTYRLANKLNAIVEVSDRFHLKPLLRAITFSHAAYVLALSENAARLIEMSSDASATEIEVPDLPKNAADVIGEPTTKDYTGTGHRHGAKGQNFHLARYVRKIDAALRPILMRSNVPLVLAAAKPLETLFRARCTITVLPQAIEGSPDRLSAAELAAAARPILDEHYASQIKDFHRLFERRRGQNRTTTDISDAARLATFGGIDSLLVDIDGVIDGFVDEETGEVTFGSQGDAFNYGVVDEITGRALRSGARVLAVRRADIPEGKDLAAILRYPI